MKKSTYPPYLILLVLLLVPVTACTTKTAAEKPQDTPSRQEQPAVEADSHTGNTISPQPAAVDPQRSKQASQPDAVSGATIDTVSGATISQQQKRTPVSEAVGTDKNMATSGAAISKKQRTPAAPAGKTAGQKNTATDKTAAKVQSEPTVAAVAQHSEQDSSETVVQNEENTGKTTAQNPTAAASPALAAADASHTKTAGKAEPTTAAGELKPADSASNPGTGAADEPAQPAAADTVLEQIPTAPSTGEPVPLAAAADTSDTPAPSAEQNVPAYETTLADLITAFEKQGGTHGYEPPPTFQEEMRDFFSPQIFTVALSKEPETEQKPKVSRMVAVEEKQRLELTYPGHGWVYVGEQTSQPGLKYEQRKLQDNTSIFMFTAEKKGDYVLHFSYFDVFTNDFVTDAVAVSVSAARSTAAKSTVKAPDYQNEADAAETQAQKNTKETASPPSSNSTANTETGTTTHTAQAASEAPQTVGSGSQSKNSEQVIAAGTTEAASSVMGNTGSITAQNSAAADAEAPLSSDQLLEKARTAIAAADAGTALTYLDNFFTTAEEKLDEGWFLKGRAYELNGSVRNIRLAIDAYKTLTDGFPQSKYWAEADARIRYITGFYINIQ